MKIKKFTAVITAACLMLSLFPIVSFANAWDGTTKTAPNTNEDGAYIITSAEELAWFADNAGGNNAVLINDIDLAGKEWTPIGCTSSSAYSGSFEGNGHTVSGLKISGSAEYMGLFGYVTGEVYGINVTGECTYSGSGYSRSYTGGIAAYNEGKIENCTSAVTITTSGSYNYAGGIVGYNTGTISACLNRGDIVSKTTCGAGGITGELYGGIITLSVNHGKVENTNSSGYYAGGIAGRVESSISAITDVYNTGNVSAYNNVGGIIGSVSGVKCIENAYSTGNVTSGSSGRYAYRGGITSYGYSSNPISKMKNCYFLKTTAVNSDLYAVQIVENDKEDICGKSEAELKSTDIISSLGGAFECDNAENPINNGYPILKWQNPNASYKAVITVSPANSLVTLVNSDGEEVTGSFADGAYTFGNLSKGNYSYTVSRDGDDYKAENGNFTIANADYYKTVTLLQNTYKVAFTVEPDYADFGLKSGDTALTPSKSEGGSYEYTLPNGSYAYTASAFGFGGKTDSITVNKSDIEKTVKLDRLPNTKTAFSLTDKTSGLAIDNFRTEVKSGNYTVMAEADGSYLLPVGKYTYKVMRSGYAKCVGGFEVSQEDMGVGTKTISLETEPSAAWDGDSDEPAYSDGAWQIATGNELAWFAGYVNGTQTTEVESASYNAVLTNDIDLGGEINWTPIGLSSYGNEYSGTFDGKGHTVSGLFIDTNSIYQGLFGKNTETSVIKNLTVEGEIKSASTESYSYIGGICGYNAGQILKCVNKVNVTSDGGCVGGICGSSAGSYSASAIILQCANYGSVLYKSGTGQYKGGICGRAQSTNIEQCSNSGSVKGNGNFVGGIAGDLASSSTITDSCNNGAISSTAFSFGGIAGRTYLSNYGSYGIINCYNAGEVNALSDSCQNYGVLIGYFDGGHVTNCYCLIEDKGTNAGLSAIGKVSYGDAPQVTVKSSADEMRGILEVLNTNKVWAQNGGQNNGYPILKWQEIPEEIPESSIKVDGELLSLEQNKASVSSGRHTIKADYRSAGKDIEDGKLVLTVCDSRGMVKQIISADKTYMLSAECDTLSGDIIKILFWESNLQPVVNAFKIDTK